MNPILAGVALAVVAGAIAAVSFRDARAVVLGLAVVLVFSAALADPMATPTGLAARSIGAILAAYLLWIAARDHPDANVPPAPSEGSRIGWPAEILLAAAAAVAGFAAHGLGAPAGGPALASAAGYAVAALAIAPVVTGRDVLRVGVGLILLIDAALLVRAALGGTPDALEQLLTAGLIAALGAAVAALARTARLDGVGGFSFAADLSPTAWNGRVPRGPEAHPMPERRIGPPTVTVADDGTATPDAGVAAAP